MANFGKFFSAKNPVESKYSELQTLNITPKDLKGAKRSDIQDVQERLSNAGLYPSPGHKYHRDGNMGPITAHGLRLVNDEQYATDFMRNALQADKFSRTTVMKMQASLNRLGFAAGDVDGRLDTDTRKAIQRYLKDDPQLREELSSRSKEAVAPRTGVKGVTTGLTDGAREIGTNIIHPGHNAGHVELKEDLQVRMQRDPRVAKYVEWTRDAAAKNGLDGNMLANQYWKESSYNPNAISHKGARGIAQFKPETGAAYGLDSRGELHDPKASIDAGARMMGNLTRKYGSQEMALIAYNGGNRAIDFVEDKMGKQDLSIQDWMSYMKQRRDLSPSQASGAWQNETYNYVRNVTGIKGDESELSRIAAARAIQPVAQQSMGEGTLNTRLGVITTDVKLKESFVEVSATPTPISLPETPLVTAPTTIALKEKSFSFLPS